MSFPIAGGSNLLSCVPGQSIGYIRQFDTNRALITAQLKQMYANGQRRLGWPILYFTGGDGLSLDSTDGLLTQKDRQNITDLMHLADDIGFVQHLVRMLPQWSADFNAWVNPTVMKGLEDPRYWQPREYARNFIFTTEVFEAFVGASSTLISLDGCPEIIPTQQSPTVQVEYAQRLWIDLVAQYGVEKAAGFAMIATPEYVWGLRKVYGDTFPIVWMLDLYPDAQESWPAVKQAINAAGLQGPGYIWSETYTQGQATVNAIKADPTELFFVLQWPIGEDTPTNPGPTQDRLTLDYKLYAGAGL